MSLRDARGNLLQEGQTVLIKLGQEILEGECVKVSSVLAPNPNTPPVRHASFVIPIHLAVPEGGPSNIPYVWVVGENEERKKTQLEN